MPSLLDNFGVDPSIYFVGMPAPAGVVPPPNLDSSGYYTVFIRFMDADGNEGISASYDALLGAGNTAIKVFLPPLFPEGAVAVVPYISFLHSVMVMCF